MTNISLDFMGDPDQGTEVKCFSIPGPGVCISVKSDKGKLDLDMSWELFDRLAKSVKSYQEG